MMQWIVSSSVLILVVIALRYVLRGKLSLRMREPALRQEAAPLA